jgi:hypothetical protein
MGGVDELDPVTGAAAVRLDLVDVDRRDRRLRARRERAGGQAEGQHGDGEESGAWAMPADRHARVAS